jgi:renalase
MSSPIAVVGAGLAGAICAHSLAQAGNSVQVFEKSRGVGGRMAVRRTPRPGDPGHPGDAPTEDAIDHGAPFFSARSTDFKHFLATLQGAGVVAPWAPSLAPTSFEPLDPLPLWVAQPDMPALCRHLLQPTAQLEVHTHHHIEALQRKGDRWHLHAAGQRVPQTFDAVVLAMPPAQASALLIDHQAAWARTAAKQPMLPCWTLLGTAAAPTGEMGRYALARPQHGPLATIIRNDLKPGRSTAPSGAVHWVAHATAQWSETFLQAPADEVLHQLQNALTRWLREPVVWQQAQVHRWRYASAVRGSVKPTEPCWWDAELALGVCGDYLGAGGVEGAWLSGQAMAHAMLRQAVCA